LFNAAALAAFIAVKALVTILLDACSAGEGGYPFVFQTLLLLPFLLQIAFYALQACAELGLEAGVRALLGGYRAMLPAVFYSLMVAVSMLLQTLSQSFLDASTFVVLMQLTLVFVALGERYILKKASTVKIWCLIFLQVACVSLYQLSNSDGRQGSSRSSTEPPQPPEKGVHAGSPVPSRFCVGLVLCLMANVSSAIGNILQQQFMQAAKTDLSTSIKLCYQHLIGFVLMALVTLSQRSARERILLNGLFDGWDRIVALTSLCLWLSFLAASTVTAYISAMAGAMGSAVVVVVVGSYDMLVNGKATSALQVACILAIASITAAYTYLKDGLARKSAAAKGHGDCEGLGVGAMRAGLQNGDVPTALLQGRSLGQILWRKKDPCLGAEPFVV